VGGAKEGVASGERGRGVMAMGVEGGSQEAPAPAPAGPTEVDGLAEGSVPGGGSLMKRRCGLGRTGKGVGGCGAPAAPFSPGRARGAARAGPPNMAEPRGDMCGERTCTPSLGPAAPLRLSKGEACEVPVVWMVRAGRALMPTLGSGTVGSAGKDP